MKLYLQIKKEITNGYGEDGKGTTWEHCSWKCREDANGRIPNNRYSIEYREVVPSQYRAKRGGYKSESQAYRALVIDIEQHGAIGIRIS